MDKYNKLNLLLIILLGVGTLYLGAEILQMQGRFEEIEGRVVETEIVINNGTEQVNSTVKLTQGATALEALRREATVRTETFPGMGEMIISINGVENNEETNEFWLIGIREEGEEEWRSSEKGAEDIKIEEDKEILFWYGRTEDSPLDMDM